MIRLTILTLTILGTLFFKSFHFVDSCFVPKWLILGYGLIIWGILSSIHILYPYDKYPKNQHMILSTVISAAVFIESIIGLRQAVQIMYGIPASVTGTLDNPAGFAACLCIGFPFCVYGIKMSRSWKRMLFMVIACTIAIGIFFSHSRTGMISLLIVSSWYIWKKIELSNLHKWLFLSGMVIICITALYFLNEDSANGRLLIWRCSVEMIIDRLFTGWGIGGFESHYMDYQAAFFRQHPNSPYTLLADTVQYPFNEYISIGIIGGIIGLLLIALLFYGLSYCYYKNPSPEKENGLLCWKVIAIFAFFSYPLMYPFVVVLLAYSTFLLLKDRQTYIQVFRHRTVHIISASFICLLCVWCGNKLYQRTKAELKWKEATILITSGKEKEALTLYDSIYKKLYSDRYYLYNYAIELYNTQSYNKSLSIALECRKYWADYDLELLLGQLYEQLGEYTKAIESYILSSFMCPNRFIPLYNLVLLYDKTRQIDKARSLAQQIINKRIKIPSYKVHLIKEKMTDYINSHNSEY